MVSIVYYFALFELLCESMIVMNLISFVAAHNYVADAGSRSSSRFTFLINVSMFLCVTNKRCAADGLLANNQIWDFA